jgi:hypothetical protein
MLEVEEVGHPRDQGANKTKLALSFVTRDPT